MSVRKQVLADFFERVIHQEDFEAVSEFFTEGILNHAGYPGHQEGLAALAAYHEGFKTVFSDIRVEILQQVEEGDTVMSYIRSTGRHTGDLQDLPATGKSAAMMAVRIDRFEGNKIAEHWSVNNFAEAVASLRN